MQLPDFLSALNSRSLPSSGQMHTAGTDTQASEQALQDALRDIDQAVRLDRPEAFPELDLAAAIWATKQMHSLWQRLHATSDADASPSTRCASDAQQASTHFSVDLVMRHLPFLAASTDSLDATDARRNLAQQLATDWPLSSVGMQGITNVSAAPLLAHDALRRTYAERIIRRRDTARQRDPGVRRAVDAVMAEHRAFATEVLAVHDELIKRPPT